MTMSTPLSNEQFVQKLYDAHGKDATSAALNLLADFLFLKKVGVPVDIAMDLAMERLVGKFRVERIQPELPLQAPATVPNDDLFKKALYAATNKTAQPV